MSKKYLDESGVTYLWGKVEEEAAAAADRAVSQIVIPDDYAREGIPESGETAPTMVDLGNDLQTIKTTTEGLTGLEPDILAGKQAMASAISSKGIPSSASDTLMTMAQNIRGISQAPIEFNGSAEYEKQLFGAPTPTETIYEQDGTPLWNLNVILANLLSDGRFSDYGGILLAEFDKQLRSINLTGCGGGGAYFLSDGSFYETDQTSANAHIWQDEYTGKMNRWVAYLFRDANTQFTITSANECPLSIYIGRSVGTLYCTVGGKIRDIIVPDSTDPNRPNQLGNISFSSTQVWKEELNIRNVSNLTGNFANGNGNIRILNVITPGTFDFRNAIKGAMSNMNSIRIIANNYTITNSWNGIIAYPTGDPQNQNITSAKIGYLELNKNSLSRIFIDGAMSNCVSNHLEIKGIKQVTESIFYQVYGTRTCNLVSVTSPDMEFVQEFMKRYSNDRICYWPSLQEIKMPSTTRFNLGAVENIYLLKKIEVGALTSSCNCSYWNPTTVLSTTGGTAEINANIRDYIAAKVSDRTDTTPLTFTFSQNLRDNLEQETEDAFAAKNWTISPARTV